MLGCGDVLGLHDLKRYPDKVTNKSVLYEYDSNFMKLL